MANNFAPLVNVLQTNLEISQKTALGAVIEVDDLDNNPILKYRFRDNGSTATSGFFIKNGVKVSANQWIEIDASELSSIFYQAGLIVGQETISVQAYDGRWSGIATGSMFTVAQNFFAPEISTQNGSVLSNEIRLVSDLFNATDRDGNVITDYMFVDRLTNSISGYFTLDGVKMNSAQWFAVSAANLDKLRFVSAGFGPFDEKIGIMASDGKYWSSVAELTITTTPNLFQPILTAHDVRAPLGAVTSIKNFFSATDADNNTIKTVWLRDTGTNVGSGFFSINGVPQTQGVWFNVPYSQIDLVEYHYANQGETEAFDIQVTDGRYQSQIKRGDIFATPRPILAVTGTDIILDNLEQVSFSSLFSKVDNGPNYLKYEVYDRNSSLISGRLTLNDVPIIQDKVYEFSAAQMANLEIRGANSDLGRTQDEMYVRGWNGLFWTDWARINANTEPVANRALQSFGRWTNITNGKTQVTYTFAEQVPTYYSPDSSEAQTFSPLAPTQRAAIRRIFDEIATFANLRFVEVPFEPTASQAAIVFGMNTQTGSQGYAYGPIIETGKGNIIADIWISDQGPTAYDEPENGTRGSFAWLTYYHEIGHAMGFDHTFVGTILPRTLDSHQVSIMSYTSSADHPPIGNTNNPASFMVYDMLEIQRLYSPNPTQNLGNTQYRFELDDTNLQTFWDAGGSDTLNYGNQVASATIDLRQGHFSSLNGVANSLLIPFNCIIENARGSRNNDIMIGNESRNLMFGGFGNDRISAMGGNDVLRGMQGNDTYAWSFGDGRDSIREEGLGGVDVLEIRDVLGQYDALQNDVSFWRTGGALVDLRIELTMNSLSSIGGATIFDMSSGGSRVETLRFIDKDGNQIGRDIDLNSVFVGSTDQKQQFRITDFQTSYGYVAVPI